MTPLPDNRLPKLTARFRPKADGLILSNLVQVAWAEESDRVGAGIKHPDLAEWFAKALEDRNPATDMDVLDRYGMTKTVDHATVTIYQEEDQELGRRFGGWDKRVNLPLPRPVRIAHKGYSDATFQTPAPWWSHPDRGLTEEGKARLADYGETWESHVAKCERDLAAAVPSAFVPAFETYAASVDAYRREYRTITDWPKANKTDAGYPTWADICDAFPVVGAYIRRRIAEAEKVQPGAKSS